MHVGFSAAAINIDTEGENTSGSFRVNSTKDPRLKKGRQTLIAMNAKI